jgi:hypothetical protein
VDGGAIYRHEVWNYQRDSLIVRGYKFGVLSTLAVYLIDRKTTSAHHELILLTPVRKWNWVNAWIATWLQGDSLSRYDVSDGTHNRLKIHKKGEVYISTSRCGEYACATIKATTDECIAMANAASKLDLSSPSVQKQLSDAGEDTTQATIQPLVSYHRTSSEFKPMVTYPVPDSIRHYSFFIPKDFEEPKPALVPFMPPIGKDCFSPAICAANEKRAVEERITKIVTTGLVVDSFLQTVMTEFIDHMVPSKHQLHPAPIEQVFERQNRPSQRRILNEALEQGSTGVVKSFLKKESYAVPNDPRVISTICPSDKLK